MLEVIHGRAVEILLKVDRVRVVFGGKEHVVTVRLLDDDSDLLDVIRVNKVVLGVEVEDMVRLERVSSGIVY